MKAVVVGGGIAGLASALAVRRQGWDVEVLERADRLVEVGAGLSLWPNALRALDELGVGDQVRSLARPQGNAGIRDVRGRWLSRTDTDALERRFGPVVMIHRAVLLEMLVDALPAEVVRTGVEVQSVAEDGTVSHAAGESRGDMVVGADGLRSRARAVLWPDAKPPRYAGYGAWRMLTREPVDVGGAGGESWGRGQRFGYAPLADGRVYCFAVSNAPEGVDGGSIEQLRHLFGGWHEPVPSLLAAVDADALMYHDLYDLPALSTFVRGRVVLVGDAAHAMTPNLGQGACQALEDAVELGDCLRDDDLPAYDGRRRARTQMITQRSARIGKVAQLQSPVAVTLRDVALRLSPASALPRSLAPVLDWPATT